MIAALCFLVACAGAAAVYWAWGFVARRARAATVEAVAKEAIRLNDSFERQVRSLPDPERPLDPKEVADALRKLRERGRDPL